MYVICKIGACNFQACLQCYALEQNSVLSLYMYTCSHVEHISGGRGDRGSGAPHDTSTFVGPYWNGSIRKLACGKVVGF